VKTISLKKVSAVAVASLGFGLLSVVPAFAAGTGTVSVGTTTPAVPVAGTATSIPVTFTFGGTEVASETFILTASLQSYPAGATTTAPSWSATADAGALTGSSFAAAATTTAAGAVRTSTSVATITQATTTPVNDAGGVLGSLVFTPSVPGTYMIKITGTGTGTAANAFIAVNVGGLAATQATSGVGTKTTTGQVGGNVTFVYSVPAASTSASVFQISATGGTILSVNSLITATPSFTTTTLDSNVAAGAVAHTGVTGVTKSNASDFSAGAVYTAGGTITSAVYDLDGASAAGRAEQFTVTLSSSVAAGVTTLDIKSVTVSTGATAIVATGTVTWGSAPVPSAQYSLLTLNAAAGTDASGAAADTTSTIASRSLSSGAAVKKYTIQVVTNDQNNTAFTGATLGASVSGPATLGISGTATDGNTTVIGGTSVSAAMTSSSIGSIAVYNNGVAGTAVITITATTATGTVTLGTKTVKFAGSASKATISQNQFIAKAGTQLGLTPVVTNTTSGWSTSANTPAFQVSLTDSTGTAPMAGATVKMTSSDTAVIVVGTCAELTTAGTGVNVASPGTFDCSVSGATGAASGKSATVAFSVLNTTTAVYEALGSTPITFTIGGAIDKCAITTDKTSYDPGAGVNLTATCTDSSGNKAYDGQTPYVAISSNKTFGGTMPTTSTQISNGKTSTTGSTGVAGLYAPSVVGAVAISGKAAATDAAPTGTAFSVALTVNDGNAALLTQIDALNAKIVALNALIAKIMKKLGVK